ncbi:MAG: hypothetical protein RL757_3230 [Bacteroidota bacterium]|jgi:hypothetical protein
MIINTCNFNAFALGGGLFLKNIFDFFEKSFFRFRVDIFLIVVHHSEWAFVEIV